MKYSIAAALLLASIEALGDPDCTWDELKNKWGPNMCLFDSECSGARICDAYGYCFGESGCPASASEADACNYDESKNPLGPNRCTYDTECAGARDCSAFGWCEGVSGCDTLLQ